MMAEALRAALCPRGSLWKCRSGRAGTVACSRELIFRNHRINVRKLKRNTRIRRDEADQPWPKQDSPDGIDYRLACLYQATLDAPIPQDMLRLVEKIGRVQEK